MAQKVVRQLVNDLDGSPAVATVQFGYDGRDYEIELSEAHAAELEEFLAPYLEHARQVGGSGRAGRRRRPPQQPRQDTEAIRRWAREHGYQVSDRGRLPTNVVTAYQVAHGGRAEGCPTVAIRRRLLVGAQSDQSRRCRHHLSIALDTIRSAIS